MFCIKCGSELKEGARFCTKCGTSAGSAKDGVSDSSGVPIESAYQQAQERVVEVAENVQAAFGTAFESQQVNPTSWSDVSASAKVHANKIADRAKSEWSTPYGVASLVGKVITLALLLMPAVSSPALKLAKATMGDSSSALGSFGVKDIASVAAQIPGFDLLFRGEWSVMDFHSLISSLIKWMNVATPGKVSGLETLGPVSLLAAVLWVACLVGVVFSIARPFIKNEKLSEIQASKNLDAMVLVPVGILAFVWCVATLMISSQIESEMLTAFGGNAQQAFVFAKLLEPTAFAWLAGVFALVTAFWPRLSKLIGLSR